MELERYNKLFDEHVLHYEEEAEARLQSFRQQCVRKFINKLTQQHDEWDITFRELLSKSQEISPELRSVTFAEKTSIRIIDKDSPVANKPPLIEEKATNLVFQTERPPASVTPGPQEKSYDLLPQCGDEVDNAKAFDLKVTTDLFEVKNPFPPESQDYFSNNLAVKEFIRIQEQQEQNRRILNELNTSPALKPFKNELNLFIRTQINSISSSNNEHLSLKTKLLVNLFNGHGVTFQDRLISAAKHPQGQLFAMDLAAQTFVTVGTRLVNSVPAIAKSMAFVINDIVKNDFPIFKDLVVGHLQERCPFIIPMYPNVSDFQNQPDAQIKFKIACGYSYDLKAKTLETEDKYISRMRSMALIFACILVFQDNKSQAWAWLASFLSLRPQPVITPTILQAFLQETSRVLLSTYGRQFKKLLRFIETDYLKMIEEVTKQPQERQPLIKLKNQLSEVI